MASVRGTAMRAQIRLLRPLLKNFDIEAERKGQDAIGALGAGVLAGRVEYRPESFENFSAEWAIPASGAKRAILYLHGGAYVAGSLPYAKGFGGILADLTGRSALCIGYRLAPEHPFPAALDDALEAYERVLEKYAPRDIAVIGESAGGGLIFCLMQALKQKKLPLPSGIVALSPWADLSCCYPSYVTNAERDPSLFESWLRACAKHYAGNDVKNPLVSPVYGDLSQLPPTLIFAGSYELLMDDTVILANKLRAEGVRCEYHISQGMWHVYVLFGIPEARRALTRIRDFLNRQCERADE
ncbi:MAG: alpha/beta hydrolase [Oscillospiraceae bacterium]|nr:alpha/beta hydrolase [Oscillospiraceae bacterium]